MNAKTAKFNLEMTLTMMMAGRGDEAEACFKRTLDYLNERIEVEEAMESLKEFVEEGPE